MSIVNYLELGFLITLGFLIVTLGFLALDRVRLDLQKLHRRLQIKNEFVFQIHKKYFWSSILKRLIFCNKCKVLDKETFTWGRGWLTGVPTQGLPGLDHPTLLVKEGDGKNSNLSFFQNSTKDLLFSLSL